MTNAPYVPYLNTGQRGKAIRWFADTFDFEAKSGVYEGFQHTASKNGMRFLVPNPTIEFCWRYASEFSLLAKRGFSVSYTLDGIEVDLTPPIAMGTLVLGTPIGDYAVVGYVEAYHYDLNKYLVTDIWNLEEPVWLYPEQLQECRGEVLPKAGDKVIVYSPGVAPPVYGECLEWENEPGRMQFRTHEGEHGIGYTRHCRVCLPFSELQVGDLVERQPVIVGADMSYSPLHVDYLKTLYFYVAEINRDLKTVTLRKSDGSMVVNSNTYHAMYVMARGLQGARNDY